jgi:hypothetical protein
MAPRDFWVRRSSKTGFQDHDEHSEDGENYFRKNANVIRGMGQRLRQCGIHSPTTLPTVWVNGTRAV